MGHEHQMAPNHHTAFCLSSLTAAATTIVLLFSPSGKAATPSPDPVVAHSLKGKSDQELLDLVVGRKSSISQKLSDEYAADRVKFSSLDRLWEMPARDAAVAFVADYVSKEVKGIRFEIDDPNAQPPKKGEVGVRWISGNKYAPRKEGATILQFDGYDSKLLVSQVEIIGRPSKQEIERVVMKTDSHPIRRLVAQQTYEILWWLRHVRMVGEPNVYTGATWSSADDFGRFWMKPDGPIVEQASFGEPCGQCMVGKSPTSYESFADTLLRRLTERSGIKDRYPMPKFGRYLDNDPDSVFLRTQSPPDGNDPQATKQWVGRLVEILSNPQRDFLYSTVMEMLVPTSDPLRYSDARIDVALLDVLHRSEKAHVALPEPQETPEEEFDFSRFPNTKAAKKELKAREQRVEESRRKARALRHRKIEIQSNTITAAAKLGLHDAVSAFPEVLRLSPTEAAAIVGRHPELRPKLVEYLQPQTASNTPGWPNNAIEIVWRADLRELTPWLERVANATPPPGQDTAEQSGNVRQEAKTVLLAWRETDPLTKTKLDIMLTGHIGRGASIPEVLRREFEALSKEDQATIRAFVTWMRTVDVPWSRRYIEHVFTPHTPRPDILIER